MWDLQDDIIIGGMRAMSIVGTHITKPLMKMVESECHVMDTATYYTKLDKFVTEQMEDPQQLLDDSAIMFADIPPNNDEIHKALYEATSVDIEFYTKQALIVILHNICVCIKRQLEDHLPGGKHHSVNDKIRDETRTCPKDNVAAERVFAGLDYLKRKSPNMTDLAMQGILLWSQNRTMKYLEDCKEEEQLKLIQSAKKQRKEVVKLYQAKVKKDF